MIKDVRFVQRFNNFLKAFEHFESAVKLAKKRQLSDLEKQGLIKSFEFTHELFWKVLKDFLIEQGAQNLFGSISVTREAFNLGLINNGDLWMEMIKDRNATVYDYDEKETDKIVKNCVGKYFKELSDFKKSFTKLTKNS